MRKISYILFTVISLEIIFRIILSAFFAASFFKPKEIIFSYYPQAKKIISRYKNSDEGKTKLLILSSSALTDGWGDFRKIIENKLNSKSENYEVFNGAGVGFSLVDNKNTYSILREKNIHFDYVIIYNAINDARLNNCPPKIFKKDYSHIKWNNEINCIKRHHEMNITVIPFIFDFLYQKIKQKFSNKRFIPDNYQHQPDWKKHGNVFLSLEILKNALVNIVSHNYGNEKYLIFSYNYYIPSNYTYKKFINKQLDYQFHENSSEVEIWGKPINVSNFIDSANVYYSHIAKKFNNTRFYDVRRTMKNPVYFADVCHFSEKGIQTFSNKVFQIIQDIENRNHQL